MANVTETIAQEKLIFFEEYQILGVFIYSVWMCIVLFGIVSNSVNITVFVKIGFSDNVTVSLLFLSISDLLNMIFNIPSVVKLFMDQYAPNHVWSFSPLIMELSFYWPAYIFYDFSSFISVFLGVVRCLCVARPLQFKSMFTVTRTLIILAVLLVAAVALRAPVLTIFRWAWDVNPQTNSTWLTLQVAQNFRDIYTINDIINRNIVSWVAYIIAVACVTILVIKLQAASRSRQSLTYQAGISSLHNTKISATGNSHQIDKSPVLEAGHQKDKSSKSKMSAKDLQVIRSVILICAIFILSQLTFQVLSTIRLYDRQFALGRSKRYAFGFLSIVANTCKYFNASVNIFVYYYFNSRYRKDFLGLFGKKSV